MGLLREADLAHDLHEARVCAETVVGRRGVDEGEHEGVLLVTAPQQTERRFALAKLDAAASDELYGRCVRRTRSPLFCPVSIHQRAIVVDMHADTVQRMIDEGADINQKLQDGHFDAVRAKAGGLDAQFFSIWVEPEFFGGGGQSAIDRADKQIAAVRALATEHPETWELATTAADVRRIAGAGRIAALMGLEGGYAIDEKTENVEKYYRLGVRYMSPAWSVSTSWAGSSGDAVGDGPVFNTGTLACPFDGLPWADTAARRTVPRYPPFLDLA